MDDLLDAVAEDERRTFEAGVATAPSFAEDLADALIRLAMSHFLLAEGDASRFERSAAAIVATMPANSPRSAR
ncbi:MAG TPA: hypothetical protein VIA11_04920 [Acidimicrobiia bacterium]|jgi:hypothetical protein|nr:hypothetical protein [Acidimicrobiia bacterium]